MHSEKPNEIHPKDRYSLLALFSDTVLFEYDVQNDVMHFTPNITELFCVDGKDCASFLRSFQFSFVYGKDRDKFRQLLSGNNPADAGEMRLRLLYRPDTPPLWCLVKYLYFRKDGALYTVVGKIADIDEQKRQEEKLLKISETDELTGLRNRHAVQTCIRKMMSRESAGILFMIDLDDFKKVNDRYGHISGDRALKYAAVCMRETFGSLSILGRIGGDELVAFVCMGNESLPADGGPLSKDAPFFEPADGETDFSAITKAAMNYSLDLMCSIGRSASHGLPGLSISIGAAVWPRDGSDYDTLFQAADDAMYRAKQSGKNRYCLYSARD